MIAITMNTLLAIWTAKSHHSPHGLKLFLQATLGAPSPPVMSFSPHSDHYLSTVSFFAEWDIVLQSCNSTSKHWLAQARLSGSLGRTCFSLLGLAETADGRLSWEAYDNSLSPVGSSWWIGHQQHLIHSKLYVLCYLCIVLTLCGYLACY